MASRSPIIVPARVKGQKTNRVMVFHTTRGCEHALKTGGCTNCGFIEFSTKGKFVPPEALLEEFESQFSKINFEQEDIKEIDIFTGGSFFDDNEVPPEVRRKMASKIAENKYIKKCFVESRPEFVIEDRVKEIKDILGNKILEVGIGLETVDDTIRLDIIKKGFTKADFERAVKILKKVDVGLLVYILLKPLELSEKEAMEDSIETIEYAFDLGKRVGVNTRIGLEPCFVAKGPKLEEAYNKGDYEVVKLWSVIEVLRRTYELGQIKVGLSDEGLSGGRYARNCDKCTNKIIKALENFNSTGDFEPLNKIECECKREWDELISASV